MKEISTNLYIFDAIGALGTSEGYDDRQYHNDPSSTSTSSFESLARIFGPRGAWYIITSNVFSAALALRYIPREYEEMVTEGMEGS